VSWYECWNIKINEDKTQAIYFSHQHATVEVYLMLKGQQVPFISHVKYLSVIFVGGRQKKYMEITYINDNHQGLTNIY
jgi:hypothetical protein